MRELKILTFCSSRSHGRTHTYTPRTIQTETPGTSFTLLNQTRAAAYSSTRRELRRVAGQPHGWKRTSAHWSSRYSRFQGEGGKMGRTAPRLQQASLLSQSTTQAQKEMRKGRPWPHSRASSLQMDNQRSSWVTSIYTTQSGRVQSTA